MKNLMLGIAMSVTLFFGAESTVLAKQGVYLGLGIPYNTIGGDFDGESFFISSDGSEIIIVPEIDGGLGFGFLLGYEFKTAFAVELSYLDSNHSASWLGLSFDVNYQIINLDIKYNFSTDQPTQPYLLIGISLSDLVVEDGAETASQSGDVTYSGTGFNLGAGVDHYFTPNISVGLGLIYRLLDYDEAEGIIGSGDLGNELSGNGIALLLKTAYHF